MNRPGENAGHVLPVDEVAMCLRWLGRDGGHQDKKDRVVKTFMCGNACPERHASTLALAFV
jgi:hypothetical protein